MKNKKSSHPPSLKIFFATEMWERYGFYVVQTLLALFLAFHFKWSDKNVYALVGSFTALTYISPLIGGWVADYLIGQKRSILAGAFVLLLSYLSLALVAFDGGLGSNLASKAASCGLIASLAGIAVGTGLLKPNISCLLGNEYLDGSANREDGFTIFFMGITSGIILGSTVPGILHQYFGWPTSFLSAVIGLSLAIAVFSFGIKRYHIADYQPYRYSLRKTFLAGFILLLVWLGSYCVLTYPALANYVFLLIVLLSLLYFHAAAKQEQEEIKAKQVWVIALLCLISIMFWALYFQMFLSLTLFISRVVEPQLWGMSFTAPYYVSIQSLGTIIFGFILSRSSKGTQDAISSGNKFVYSLFFMTAGFIMISLACHQDTNSPKLISPLLLLPAYLMISMAELLLYPVGLSAITLLASPKKVSTMMGIFFVSLGIGAFLSGKLAFLTAIPAGETSITLLKTHYALVFNHLLLILVVALLICCSINFWIKYLLQPKFHLKFSKSLHTSA